MSKIVLIAYHSDQTEIVPAVLQLKSILHALPSQTIFNRFEAFDVVDSLPEEVAK